VYNIGNTTKLNGEGVILGVSVTHLIETIKVRGTSNLPFQIKIFSDSSSHISIENIGYIGYFDGSRPNQGSAMIGLIIEKNGEKILKRSKVIENISSNYSEYMALLELSKEIKGLGIKKITVFGDSKVVINNMTFDIDDKYKDIREKIKTHLSDTEYYLQWLPSKENKADELTRPKNGDGKEENGKDI